MLVPNLIFTYLAYKTDDEFEDFLQSFFNKVGIENDVYFVKQNQRTKKERIKLLVLFLCNQI